MSEPSKTSTRLARLERANRRSRPMIADLFRDFFDWMAALPVIWMYVTVFVIAWGENVAPPIPGDMVIVFGGYLAGLGVLNLPAVIALATLGGSLGFLTMYTVGYRVGNALLDPDRYRWLPKQRIRDTEQYAARWGWALVAANRFLSGLRSVISLSVGISRMPAGRTAIYATCSAFVWTALIAWLGYVAGENWTVVKTYLSTYSQVIITLMVFVALGILGRVLYRRRKTRAT